MSLFGFHFRIRLTLFPQGEPVGAVKPPKSAASGKPLPGPLRAEGALLISHGQKNGSEASQL